MSEDLALSKIYLGSASSPFKIVGNNLLRILQRAARAVLRSLHDSRARAARKVMHDYRHLLDESRIEDKTKQK